ncbi:hypothetical protein M758_6G151400 [Ceratodon purpureus]|uniref:NEDD8-activating enzyme E1 regulatory subunit n=1 Tax=Ceratodon purpureus TaxID=3225 RepID=A0A8T0HF17_CERPU|nr:hypothetical protein KC19_6G156600 [Ceratodon purpureus]KAG0614102.1 hypothetical protein M758_6G151400 [Ceratodon purpureus]
MAQRNNKYDRQLRIWGEHGQTALETARVCVLNCGPTGSEALKNLVLGGIGSFTIVDASKVSAADLGNNYLVDWESLGQSKAKSVCALLQELNESVGAKFVEESPEALLESNPAFFAQFTLVIATQMTEAPLLKLEEICRQQKVMLVIARSYGLAGLVRISVTEHDIIESKPDNKVEDLRLHKPWPELQSYVDEFDIDTQDHNIHKHIPFAILLIKIAEDWKKSHDGKLPANVRLFKEAITARRRVEEDEDNYNEALKSAYIVLFPPSISSQLRAVLEDKASDVDASSSDFWIMVSALKQFMANEGQGEPPLDGAIPDMHSFTDYYIKLQKIYQARAEADVTAVEGHVARILKQIGRESSPIPRSTIKLFCKNARNLRVLRCKMLSDEFSSRSGPELQRLLAVEESSHPALYVLLRAVDHFAATYNRFPGVFDGEMEEDVSRLKSLAVGLLNDMGGGGASLPEDVVSEICRFGAGEIHCVASIVGGIASQECIKLLTRQFTPIQGTFIYNAMSATSLVLNV